MWASGDPEGDGEWPSSPPIDLQDTFDPVFGYSQLYYDFIFNVCTFYRGRIDRLTIENEVNTQEFWTGSLEDYRKILATAAKAVEDAAPEILLFESGLGSGSWGVAMAEHMHQSGDFSEAEILQFVNEYYEYNTLAPLSFADYPQLIYWLQQPFVQQNNKHVRFILSEAPQYIDGINFKFTESHWLLPRLVNWMDEMMADNGQAVPLKVNNEAANWERSDALDEARNMFKMITSSLGNGVEQTLWFPYSNQTTVTFRRGLFDENGDRTAQADVFENLARRIGPDYAFVVHDTLGNVQRYRFQRPDVDAEPTMDIMWWDNGGHGSGVQTVEVDLPDGTETVIRYNTTGESMELAFADGVLSTAVNNWGRIYVYQTPMASAPGVTDSPVASLAQNQPNPFNPRTRISVTVDQPVRDARIEILDARGRVLRTLELGSVLSVGEYERQWDGRGDLGFALPSGTYYYRLVHADGSSPMRRAVLLK